MKKITSVKELRKQIDKGNFEYFIALNGGLMSSKLIYRNDNWDDFDIENQIDGTEQTLTEAELFDRELTNIGYAMQQGSFYMR